jgi:wyosine [tRNA(Phe)-imidazoG37] synthetase (radical SAM superfamily)
MTDTDQREPLPASAPTIFGPVPSRRLGQSLGIGNVPPKTCS